LAGAELKIKAERKQTNQYRQAHQGEY